MAKTLLPLGVDNFGKLVRYRTPEGEPYLFADKSILIDTFVRSNDTISLITRPRRFGKTLNLSMLQHFFAAKVGQESTAGLFENLNISGHPEIMAYQGRYPVIFVTLKEVRGRTFDECLQALQGVIAELFKEHAWLLGQEGLMDEADQALYSRYRHKQATIEEYQTSLRLLSQLLQTHHKEQVVMLLDEYARQEVASNNCIASL